MRQTNNERPGTELAVRPPLSLAWAPPPHTDEEEDEWDQLEKQLFPNRSPTSAIVVASPPSAVAVASPSSVANAGKAFTDAEIDALGDAPAQPSPAAYTQLKKRKKGTKKKKRLLKRELAEAKKAAKSKAAQEAKKAAQEAKKAAKKAPVLDKVEEAATPRRRLRAKCKATPEKAAAPCKEGVAQKEKGETSKPDPNEHDVVVRYLQLEGISIKKKRHRLHSNVYDKERIRVRNSTGDDVFARSKARKLAKGEVGRFDAEVKRLKLYD